MTNSVAYYTNGTSVTHFVSRDHWSRTLQHYRMTSFDMVLRNFTTQIGSMGCFMNTITLNDMDLSSSKTELPVMVPHLQYLEESGIMGSSQSPLFADYCREQVQMVNDED